MHTSGRQHSAATVQYSVTHQLPCVEVFVDTPRDVTWRMHAGGQKDRIVLSFWLLWLLTLSYFCNATSAVVASSSRGPQSHRSLLVEATLYCNITSE